jgi:hypothetical protein
MLLHVRIFALKYLGRAAAGLSEIYLLSDSVFFSLLGNLIRHLAGRVQRVLGPIMFADRARWCVLSRGRFCEGDLVFVTFL